MEAMSFGDWIALYAAVLSTVLAFAALVRWLLSGPRLSVAVFNPEEVESRQRIFLSVISNCGSIPTVIRKLEVSFRTSRWWGTEIGRAVFDEKSSWKPSVKLVPTDRPNTFRPEPLVVHPGEEIRAPASAIDPYDPHKHWIRVTAYARNRGSRFVGWAAPVNSVRDKEIRQ